MHEKCKEGAENASWYYVNNVAILSEEGWSDEFLKAKNFNNLL